MAEVARQFDLPKEEIIRAIQAWGEKAKDPFDKAQADFIAKNYAKASAGFAEARRLRKAAREKAISEEFDACSSHGKSLFAEGKYRESAEAFQAALGLRSDDGATMNNLAVVTRVCRELRRSRAALQALSGDQGEGAGRGSSLKLR
jgi:tetratricopeptide (TPR) repeat protein